MCILTKMKKNQRSDTAYIDTKTLNALKNQSNTSIEVQKQNYHLGLHPFHLSDLKNSVKDTLNNDIARYNKKLKGILLGYQNIQITSPAAPINFDACFIHVDIAAEFFLFKPKVGDMINGVVNKKSENHIGCLVHKTFNVSILKDEDDINWLGNKAQIGHEVLIEVSYVQLENRLPYIRGILKSILNEDSGISTSEECSSPKKNTIIKFDESIEKSCEKKKKKKKNKKEDPDETFENIKDVTTVSKKKHKKHKESKDDLNLNESIKRVKKKKKDKDIIEPEETTPIVDLNLKKKKKHKEKGETSSNEVQMDLILNNIKFYDAEDLKKSIKQEKTDNAMDICDNIESQSNHKKHKKIKKEKKDPTNEVSLGDLNLDQVLFTNNDSLNNSKHKKHKRDKTDSTGTDINDIKNVNKEIVQTKKRKRSSLTISSDNLRNLEDILPPEAKKAKIRRHSIHVDTVGKQKIHLIENIILKEKSFL